MPHLPALVVDLFRLGLWLILLAAVFSPLERLFALRPRKLWTRQTLADLVYFFLNGLVPAVLVAAPASLIVTAVHWATPRAYADFVASLPFGLKLAAGLVVAEIGAYWAHRLCHEVPWLWRFHAVHHAPTHINWLVNTRAHPFDLVFTRLCGLAPLYALGLAQPTAVGRDAMIPVYVTLFGVIWSFFIHANLRWRFGPLEWLISTPAFYHWHHTNDEHRDHNYAALFPLVDKMFGTLHLPNRWPDDYGIDTPPPEGVTAELLYPLGLVAPRR